MSYKRKMKPRIKVYAGDYVLGSTQGQKIRVVTKDFIIHIKADGKIEKIRKTWES